VRAWIEYSHVLDADDWRRRHDLGEVPDALPYGLDRLGRHGVDLRVRPPLPQSWRPIARVARRGGYEWVEAVAAPVPADAEVCVCWEERIGAPRALRSGRRVAVASGAIWITDSSGPLHRMAIEGLRRCAVVWALSGAQLSPLTDMGVPRSRVEQLVFGVDADFFTRPDGVDREPGLVVSAGRDPHRDWPTLLDAFAEVRRHRPDARLEIASPVPLTPAPGVTLHPHLTHSAFRALLARAWVVAVPTRDNLHVSGMTTALEAKAVQAPVLVSRTPGIEDYVTQKEGRLLRVGDVASWAGALLDLLDADAGDIARMGGAGRRSVEAVHNTERQAKDMAALLARHC